MASIVSNIADVINRLAMKLLALHEWLETQSVRPGRQAAVKH